MHVSDAVDPAAWDSFVASGRYRPFLQGWTMGEVYRDIGQEPVRLEARDDAGRIAGICQAVLVPARRGRHLMVPYGPLVTDVLALPALLEALKARARERGCSFLRMSPFWPQAQASHLAALGAVASPLHLLAEHVWYLPLTVGDAWAGQPHGMPRTEDELFQQLRKTTRNLVRRAEKEGVAVEVSPDPVRDVERFIALHDETRKRHKFTPYTNAFFRAQVARFAPRGEVTVYLAKYQGQVIAASVHMHAYGETSYHHGASSSAFPKIPASYLLQWTAVRDALKRGDAVYSFWGIAPMTAATGDESPKVSDPKHPFAGVTLFKTGYGGAVLDLVPCMDLPLSPYYRLTRAFEYARKWKRGF